MPVQLWIVGGPSSAGKSTFLADPLAPRLTSLAPDAPILFPADITPETEITVDSYLHYNLLRPAWRLDKQGRDLARATDFGADHKWRRIVDLPAQKRAVLVRADREELLARVDERDEIEPGIERDYPRGYWAELYERIDVDAIYEAWLRELTRLEIPCIELRSGVDGFTLLAE